MCQYIKASICTKSADLRDAAYGNCIYQGSRRIASWVWHLLRHVQYHVECGEGKRGLKETQGPSHSVRPVRFVIKVGKDIFDLAFGRLGQEYDTGDHDTRNGPVHYMVSRAAKGTYNPL